MKMVVQTKTFKKNIKRYRHNQKIKETLKIVVRLLLENQTLPQPYKDHTLKGKYVGIRECHLQPDTLLLYKLHNDTLILMAIGSHSDLF